MPRASRITALVTALQLLSLLLGMPVTAWGLSSDRDQPMYIEADQARLDDRKGVSIYEGNVHLRQGTLRLYGDSMTVTNTGEQVEKVFLQGNPATYSQRPDGKDIDLNAEAGKMEYFKNEDRMILLENARVWQEDGNEFRSERIVYDIKNNVVKAGGKGKETRVHITLQPKARQEPGNGEAPE